ncbi:MAG: hypothetical protein Q8N26_03990 [Myxococcales bacterium]|nr:hypothetical protein [Myxococcales bacterium]
MRVGRVVLSSTLLLLSAGCGAPDLMMWVSRVERRGTQDEVTIKLSAVGADRQPGRGRVELEVTSAEVNSPFVELDADGLGTFELRQGAGEKASVSASWEGATVVLEGYLKPKPSTGSTGSTSSTSSTSSSSSGSALPTTFDAGAVATPAMPSIISSRPEPIVPASSCPASAGNLPGFSAVVVVLNRDRTPARSSVEVSRGTSKACAVTDASGRARFSGLGVGRWQTRVTTTTISHTTVDNGPYEPAISTPTTFFSSVPYRIAVSDVATNEFELQSGF